MSEQIKKLKNQTYCESLFEFFLLLLLKFHQINQLTNSTTIMLNFRNEIAKLIQTFVILQQNFKQSEYYCNEKYIAYCEITIYCCDSTRNENNIKYIFTYGDCAGLLDDLDSIVHHKTYEDEKFKEIITNNISKYKKYRNILLNLFFSDFKKYTCSEIYEYEKFSTGKTASFSIKNELTNESEQIYNTSVFRIVQSTGEIFHISNKDFFKQNELNESSNFEIENVEDVENFDFDYFEELFDENKIVYIETITKNNISCCYHNNNKISLDLLSKIINGISLFESIKCQLEYYSDNDRKYLVVHTIDNHKYIINKNNLSSHIKNINFLASLFDNGKISKIIACKNNKLTTFSCTINGFEIDFEFFFKYEINSCDNLFLNAIELSMYPDDINVNIIFNDISDQLNNELNIFYQLFDNRLDQLNYQFDHQFNNEFNHQLDQLNYKFNQLDDKIDQFGDLFDCQLGQFDNLKNFVFYTKQGHVQELKLKFFFLLSSNLKQMFANGDVICIENEHSILFGTKIKVDKRKQMHNSFYNKNKQRKLY